MSIHENDSSPRPQSDQAISWFARLRAADVTGEERAQFERWRNDDPANAAAFSEIESLWNELGQIVDPEETSRKSSRSVRLGGRTRWLAIAASLVAAAGLLLFGIPGKDPASTRLYSTNNDAPRTVSLTDGSSIYLFKDSAISVRMDDGARRVTLEHGAGIFDVAHEPSRGFFVSTKHGIVRVVGTVFDVHTDSDQSTITVISGTVIVGFDDRQNGPEFTLQDGNRASYSRTGKTEVVARDAAATRNVVLSARNQLIFEDVPLESVVSALNQHFDRKLWLGSDGLKQLKVSAVLDLSDQDSVVRGIEQAFDVEAISVSGNLIVLYPPDVQLQPHDG